MDDASDTFVNVFSLKPDQFPYGQKSAAVERIRQARLSLGGQLFFDRLLSLLVAPVSQQVIDLYPPKHINDLRELYRLVESSSADGLRKQSIYYYILHDWSTQDSYANSILLPENFCSFMDGYYYLDSLEFEAAVVCLTAPDVKPLLCDEIFSCLREFASTSLAFAFVESIGYANINDQDALFDLHCTSNITSAFMYIRHAPENVRSHLLIRLTKFCLGADPPRTELETFTLLPLLPNELLTIRDYISKQASTNSLACDTLVILDLYHGKFDQAKADLATYYSNDASSITDLSLTRNFNIDIYNA